MWSDPDKDVANWGENDRGVSFIFGSNLVEKFLHKHDFDLIARAHQVGRLGARRSFHPGACNTWTHCVRLSTSVAHFDSANSQRLPSATTKE